MKPHEVAVVFGTRPEAIKMAPVVLALQRDARFKVHVIVTGQHREMLTQVLDLFELRVDVNLQLMTHRQGLAALTAAAVDGLSTVVDKLAPDAIVVQGDTTTTFCAALTGFYHQIPVVHLEAGLRTDDPYSPFPEELNRRLTSQLASLHLAPTAQAAQRLIDEGHDPDAVVLTGNTVIDALQFVASMKRPWETPELKQLDDHGGDMVLVTAHRRESWGAGMQSIAASVAQVAGLHPEVLFVLPMHRNPVVRDVLVPALSGLDNVVMTDPVAYTELVKLLDRCRFVLTDSGGIQEEAPGLGKPVLVMRSTTERPEGVQAGVARLVGTDQATIVSQSRSLLTDELAYRRMATAVNPYGDGRAAERSVGAMADMLERLRVGPVL